MLKLLIGNTGGRQYHMITDAKMMRDFCENYHPKLKGFIGDLSMMGPLTISVLLKFLEEKAQDFTCYASRDNLLPTITSRFTKIEKNYTPTIGKDDFDTFVAYTQERDVQVSSEIFLELAPSHLDKYLLYKKMSPGLRERIGQFI